MTAAAGRPFRLAAMLAVLVASLLAPSAATALEMQEVRSGEGPIRVLTFNVLGRNKDYARFAAYLERVDPDLVLLQEAGREWIAATPLKLYPFRRVGKRMVIASRLKFGPTESVADPRLAIVGDPFMRLQVELASGGTRHLVSVYNVHPTSPRVQDGMERRLEDYATLAANLAKEPPGRALIVAGDFNAAPGSDLLDGLVAGAGLTLADGGTLAVATRFAREYELPSWLGVAIDHVATRGPFRVLGREVGPDLGSDHLPVVVDMEFAPPP